MKMKVFISHGHDELAKHKLKDFVRDRLGMEPVVLADQPDLGFTIVEKLEHYGRKCQFALILLTGDDETTSGGLRARQNVIHELGYFHGVLGRNRVILLKGKEVDLFSNISGLIYKEFPTGLIESIFEDIRQAVESGDASMHAESIPIESNAKYTNEDWMTAAIVGSEHAETTLKKLAGSFSKMKAKNRSEKQDHITTRVEAEIDMLLKKHENGGSTDDSRLDACIAKIIADILQRELANFQWTVEDRQKDDPVKVFRETVKGFIDSEKNKWSK